MSLQGTHWKVLGALGLAAALGTPSTGRDGQDPAVGTEVSPVTEVTPARPVPRATSRAIDIAICLDTSGSMKGLIDAARQKIWAIVNDLALAKPEPRLRVALLVYGGQSYSPEDGYVRVETPLTVDLDLVSQKLFALAANGSVEYVGRVIDTSTRTLEWTTEPGALKLIVVAGNESADQDREVPFREACARAIGRDVMVNAIYCGPETDAIAPLWREVARLADGQYASIDKDNGTVVITTPFDTALGKLSADINTTYLYYGTEGEGRWFRQQAQDRNAEGLNSEATASRATLKGGALYCNSHWDLVDACKAQDFDLAKVEVEHLPEHMQKMSLEERRACVTDMGSKRAKIQKEIADLSSKRRAFIEQELAKRAVDDSRSFDFALRKAIRAQGTARGFRFPEPPASEAPAAPASDAPAPADAPGATPPPPPVAPPVQQGGGSAPAPQRRSGSVPQC